MNLDVKTFLLMVALSYLTSAILLLLLSLSSHSTEKRIRLGWATWGGCMFASAICAFLFGQRGAIPDYLGIVFANALLIVAFGLRPNAMTLLNGRRMRYLGLPVVGLLGWLGLYAFEFFRNDMLLRVFYVNGFCFIATSLCLWEATRLNTRQVSTWLLVSAFGIDLVVRSSLIGTHMQRHYPALLEAYETFSLQLGMLLLIIGIFLKVVGISITVFEGEKNRFKHEASTDPVTGLATRRKFLDDSEKWLVNNQGTTVGYALVLMEIDRLKDLEDRFGTSMKEAFLRLTTQIIGKHTGSNVISGHLREQQIGLFLPNTGQTGANAVAKQISRIFRSETSAASSGQVKATLSIGIHSGPVHVPIQRAVEIADHCLRQARQTGGNEILSNEGSADSPISATSIPTPFALKSKDADFKAPA